MKVEKIIKTTESTELDIIGATLLTVDEVKALPVSVRRATSSWWLRSATNFIDFAAFVDGEDGDVDAIGIPVSSEYGVRPALQFNLKSSNLKTGDKFKALGYVWDVISENKALCADVIGYSAFREDWQSESANDYEKSDIKKYVDNWFESVKE